MAYCSMPRVFILIRQEIRTNTDTSTRHPPVTCSLTSTISNVFTFVRYTCKKRKQGFNLLANEVLPNPTRNTQSKCRIRRIHTSTT